MCIRDRYQRRVRGRFSFVPPSILATATAPPSTRETRLDLTAPPAVSEQLLDPLDMPASSTPSTLMLGLIFAGWYLASAFTGTSTKALLGLDTSPLLITLMQFTTSAILSRVACAVRGQYTPLTVEQYQQFLPVCMAYTFGFLCLNCSLGQGNVSFMETLRACEPLFSLFFVKLFLPEEHITRDMYLAVVPIVAGIALSSLSEPSFSTAGFLFASAANVCFASRSLFVKKLKGSNDTFKNLDAVSMIHHQHLLALPLLTTLVLANDGVPDMTKSSTFLYYSVVNGSCFYSYNQLSLVVLYCVTMASHSIGNAFRRVATIVFAVIVFGNPVSYTNVFGIVMAIGGVTLYSRAAAAAKASK
eukprot:TRINITY_DN17295_c0_g1_i2.p2 TRINITY_DN17295_c0_g1~~TRINITY_DN17295_c0_g1_i2.p2  ORF type:complete len:359 (-),score=84.41 TRINITY_DN17295_c0_g1_i2:158-1234(-)